MSFLFQKSTDRQLEWRRTNMTDFQPSEQLMAASPDLRTNWQQTKRYETYRRNIDIRNTEDAQAYSTLQNYENKTLRQVPKHERTTTQTAHTTPSSAKARENYTDSSHYSVKCQSTRGTTQTAHTTPSMSDGNARPSGA